MKCHGHCKAIIGRHAIGCGLKSRQPPWTIRKASLSWQPKLDKKLCTHPLSIDRITQPLAVVIMGFFDFVSDVYSSITITHAEAEDPQYQGQPDKSGEQSSSKDARQGGMGTAQHDRGATTRGGVSTATPAAGTNEESDSEKEANAEDADKAKSRSSDEDDGETTDGAGAVPDTDGVEEEAGGEEEEEEEEDDDEPKDPKPKFEEGEYS